MDLDLRFVADFLVVLEENSFRRAAERRYLSVPALSRRIQRLEHQVGVPLLRRGPEGSSGPTDAGLAFAAGAGALLEAARAACAQAHAAALPPVRWRSPAEGRSLTAARGRP
ncbi:helix-turn-helix domain-containing protein [Geodermatophilus sp. SYSU D00815]